MRTPLAVPRAWARQRPVRTESGFRSPVSGFDGSAVSGLELFAGIPYRAIRGRLGDRVYKTYGDKVIVTRVPCFDGYVPTAAQRKRREKLREATAYAQAVYADPAAKAIYVAAAKQLGRQPFRLAVADFLRGRPRVKLDLAAKSPAKVSGRNSPAGTRRVPAPSRLHLVHPHSRPSRMPPPAGIPRVMVTLPLHSRASSFFTRRHGVREEENKREDFSAPPRLCERHFRIPLAGARSERVMS
jgi:hypothetical protein